MSAHPRDDEELVAAWQAGDEAAFAALVDRFTPRVFGICHRYFGDATQAEEATQETFVTLYRRGHSFRGQARFSTWLYRVTTNVCHDLTRRRARRPDTVPLTQPGGDGGGAWSADRAATDAADALLAVELGEELAGALAHLDAGQRAAVVLHDVHGYTYEEIAERCGVATGTAKSRVHRGHARLAAALGHLRSEPARGSPEPGGGAPDAGNDPPPGGI